VTIHTARGRLCRAPYILRWIKWLPLRSSNRKPSSRRLGEL